MKNLSFIVIQVLVVSQHGATVQPKNAEAYDAPDLIAEECQLYSNSINLPVVCIDREGKQEIFIPDAFPN